MTKHAASLVRGIDGMPLDPMAGVRQFDLEVDAAVAEVTKQMLSMRVGGIVIFPMLPAKSRFSLGVCP